MTFPGRAAGGAPTGARAAIEPAITTPGIANVLPMSAWDGYRNAGPDVYWRPTACERAGGRVAVTGAT